VLVEQPGPPAADVQRLEDAVAAQHTKIIRSEDRRFRWDDADAEESYHTLICHAGQL
jgi:hypothetical protein